MLMLRLRRPVNGLARRLLLDEIDQKLEGGMQHNVIFIAPPLLQRMDPQHLHLAPPLCRHARLLLHSTPSRSTLCHSRR